MRVALFALLAATVAAPALAQEQVQPEQTFAVQTAEDVTARDFMVAAANPLAVQAGYDALAAGGTAADALVAVQMMLNLVEPQSSGIGGGAFLRRVDDARWPRDGPRLGNAGILAGRGWRTDWLVGCRKGRALGRGAGHAGAASRGP